MSCCLTSVIIAAEHSQRHVERGLDADALLLAQCLGRETCHDRLDLRKNLVRAKGAVMDIQGRGVGCHDRTFQRVALVAHMKMSSRESVGRRKFPGLETACLLNVCHVVSPVPCIYPKQLVE